jgi:hypothetical protein
VNLIAIGNGTASRETDKLAADLIKRLQQIAPDTAIEKVVVSEAGASVYSASEYASKELPELDVSLRGAASPSPAGCRTRWPSWSRSTPRASAWASTSTTSTRASWPAPWTRWSRTA